MEYSINKLSKIAGVSARTLRYYDQIGLLKPARINSSKYRIYGKTEVDALQQILFFRELGFALEDIKDIINSPDFDREKVLYSHLATLETKKAQLEMLIANVTKTIGTMKGATTMTDKEKFEGFKQNLVDENEAKYGDEVRKKYGNEAVEASNHKVKNMSPEQYAESERLRIEIDETLKAAMDSGDPASELAQKACDLHRLWLCHFWEDSTYSKEAHMGLTQMYCDDERFKAYYERIAPGCAEFLRSAMRIYTG